MALVTLPPEILEIIVGYIASENGYTAKRLPLFEHQQCTLAPYATVSRTWQELIERYTFSRLWFTPERLETALASTLLNSRRFSQVRIVDVTVVLPDYDLEDRSRFETDADRAANNDVFTQTVQDLFRLFARGTTDGVFSPEADVALVLRARSPSDNAGDRYGMLNLESWRRGRMHKDGDLCQARYAFSALELVGDEDTGPELPLLPMITSFTCIPPHWRRYVAPAACVQIAARLPRLRSVVWTFSDEKREPVGRRARRTAFARVLPRLPPSLTDVKLEMASDVKNDLFGHPTTLMDVSSSDSAATYDGLSAALGRWARRSVKFRLNGIVTVEFWAALAGDDSDDTTSAARTSHLVVGLNKVLPTGEGIFALPPLLDDDDDDDDEEYDYPSYAWFFYQHDPRLELPKEVPESFLRVRPRPQLWNQVLLASSRAVARLPQLQWLRIKVPGPIDAFCEATYLVAEREVTFASFPSLEDTVLAGGSQPVDMPNLFQPEPDVVQAWKKATKVQCEGVEADIKNANTNSRLYNPRLHLDY